jgi:DNA-binding NtrC family response regulator
LRKRKEDLPLLADYLLRKKCSKNNLKTLSPEALSSLQKYDFPGNVRELANLLERGIIMSQSSVIEAEHLFCQPMENTLLMNRSLNQAENEDNKITNNDLSLEACEKQHIKKVLNLVDGNKTQAANLLKIGLKTLYRKINKYGLS